MNTETMDVVVDSQKKVACYLSSNKFGNSSQQITSSTRHRSNSNFSKAIHDSVTSSLDFPTYIPWQTLSSEVSDKLRNGSVKINRSNRVEWASTIKEEFERTPLLDKRASSSESNDSSEKGVTAAVKGGISWKVSAFLLINAALGAGVLNYPSAYDRVGGIFYATVLQCILIAVLAGTMFILVYSSDLNKDSTYHDVLLTLCGKRAQQLSALSILLTCYGICITFLIIIGDQYDRVFSATLTECVWYVDRRFTISITAIVLILPMCYFQRLDFLRYAGTLGVFAMLYVVFLNVYQYYTLVIEDVVIRSSPASALNIMAIIPVMCFAYQCHEIVVPVYACMEDRSMKSFAKVTALALFLLFVLYCTAGTYGYLTFGSRVSPDIMLLYNAKDPLVVIGIVALVVKMITTYPPMIVCGRGAFDGLYAEFRKLSAEEFIEGEFTRRCFITTLWFFSSLFIAVFTPNIGVVIEILGSLASVNVFIFPSLCLIAITRRADIKIGPIKKLLFRIFSVTLIILGVVIFSIVLYQVVQDFQKGGESVTHEVLCK